MQCCEHILNLVVKDSLKEQHEWIARISNAIRYVRSSPDRLEKFKKSVERENIECDKMVCLDFDTRWNSTYNMLDVAVKYKGAFIRMITEDSNYEPFFKGADLGNMGAGLGVLSGNAKKKKKIVEDAHFFVDFDNVIRFVQFLKIFYDVTLKLSGSKYCTSNVFFVELVKVQESIIKLCSNEDILMRDMANRMKDKYDKYWDNMENTNFLLYVAVVLDPRELH
ncbi:zinc finger BED domain-containing protein RICESLEEPER 2-like [Apium graveolens]|uniref:zinc finger BED domain-containing protein RICESLEEPER 2-like n=1 Tax=Apium graveolens TaxID=4045 RepID=UPI003D78CBEE